MKTTQDAQESGRRRPCSGLRSPRTYGCLVHTLLARTLAASLAFALSLGVAGCFTAGTAGLLVVAGGGGGGGGGGTVTLPVVTVQDPPSEAGGDVRLSYTLVEDTAQPLDIVVKLARAGQAAVAVTEATGRGSDGTQGLSASRQGTAHVFIWNSFADTGPTGGQTATLTISVTNPATQAEGNAVSISVVTRNDYIQSALSPALGSPDRFAINPEVALVPGTRGQGSTQLLIADPQQHRVWRLDLLDGALASIAGIGVPGFSDDVPAHAASLNTPVGLAADPEGNIFIADSGNARVRRIDAATGFISTVAGGGPDVVGQGDGGAATLAHLVRPERIALDAAGNLYISDAGAQRVRVVNRTAGPILLAGKTVQPATIETILNLEAVTVAVASAFGSSGTTEGRSTFLQASLQGIAVWETPSATTSPVEVYVVESRLPSIVRLTSSSSTPRLVYKGGDGASGDELSGLAGLTVSDASGPLALYTADPTGSVIARLLLTGSFLLPHHVVWDPEIIAGQHGDVGFKGDGADAKNAELNRPQGVAVGLAGGGAALFVADTGNQVVRAVNLGNASITLAGTGIEAGHIQSITGGGDESPANPSVLATPTGGALLPDGTAVIADFFGGTVMRIDPVTRAATTIATGLRSPGGLALLPVASGPPTQAAVSEVDGHYVFKVPLSITGTPTGTPITRTQLISQGLVLAGTGTSTGSKDENIDGGPSSDDDLGDEGSATDATLHTPLGLSVQDLGQGRFRLFIADGGNHRIRVVDENGIIHTYVNDQTVSQGNDVFTPGGYNGGSPPTPTPRLTTLLRAPFGVYVDATSTLLWISDTGNHLIRKVPLESPTGTASALVETVVGSVTSPTTTASGYNGDNRPALGASLNEPLGLIRVGERLFIADQKNQRIRVVLLDQLPPPLIFTSAGTGGQGFNGDGIPPENAALSDPAAVFYGEIDGEGVLYLGDTGNVRLRRYAP